MIGTAMRRAPGAKPRERPDRFLSGAPWLREPRRETCPNLGGGKGPHPCKQYHLVRDSAAARFPEHQRNHAGRLCPQAASGLKRGAGRQTPSAEPDVESWERLDRFFRGPAILESLAEGPARSRTGGKGPGHRRGRQHPSGQHTVRTWAGDSQPAAYGEVAAARARTAATCHP